MRSTYEHNKQKILAAHEDGFTPREIFESLKEEGRTLSIGSVYAVLSQNGLSANQKRCGHCGQLIRKI